MPDETHNPPQPESPQPESSSPDRESMPLGTHQPRAIDSADDLGNLAGEPFLEAGAPVEPAPHDPLLEAAPAEPQPSRPNPQHAPNRLFFELRTLAVAAAGWIIPGAGYLIQRRWSRALIGFLAVGAFAVLGMKMRGNVFPPHGTEPFDYLGYVADLGSGFFYFIAKTVETAGPDVSRASGDYGTRLIATAGVLNVLLILDAIQIARGEKS